MGQTYGAMMRPGAPPVPSWVWQALQSPFVYAAFIARTLFPCLILTV